MRKFLLFLTILVFNFSLVAKANTIEFNSFVNLKNCIPFNADIKKYSADLKNCFQEKNYEFSKDFISSLKRNLPDNFFTRVSFGKEAEQFIDKNFVAKDPKITIEEYLKNFPNQIYAVDNILRGENAIIREYDLNKLDLLQRLYANLPAKPITQVIRSSKVQKQQVQTALSIFSFGFYRAFFADQEECSINPTLSQTGTSIDENSTDTIDFTITLDTILSSGLTFAVDTSGTATEGTDYETIDDVTISGTTGTFSITPTDDSISDINETIDLTLTATSANSQLCNSTLSSTTVTLVDNEAAPTITLAASASTIAENAGSSITLTATSSIISGSDITVSFDTSSTATEGTDYGTISDITISAGSTTGTTTFTPTDDSMYETSTDETATIAIGTVTGGSATENGNQSVTITIEENDSAPTVTLAASSTSIDENSDSSITLTATLSNPTSQDVTVSIGTSGSATEGTDYGTISDITISSGDTTGTASFTPTDDNLYETSTDETATVSITGVSGGSATESGTQAVTLTIEENESAPTVTLSTSGTSIDENSSSVLTLTATLSVATTADVTVTIATSGAATEGTDYTDGSGNIDDLVITAGNTTETISFKPTDDSVYEGDETATISISGVSGGEATESGTQAVSITISENESAPTVTLAVSATSIAENSGSTLTLTATSSIVADEDITVSISTSGTATEGTDYGTISDITISAGNTTGTATFDPTDDSISDVSETAVVAISGVSGADGTESGTQTVTITITDNEATPTITFAVSATSIAENAGSSLTLTATSSIVSSADITVTLGTSGTATEGTDYGSVSDITITAGATTGTTTFTPTDDSMYETSTNETATISVDGVSGGSASEDGTQAVTITITENESAPTVSLSVNATSIAENAGSSLTITATLSGTTSQDVTVSLSSSSTATEGTDYGTVSDITISSGSTTGTASFTPTDDSLYDAASNETAIISISGVSGGGATENGDQKVTITITDNESAPTVTLTVSASSIAENAGSSLTLTATLSGTTYQDVTVGIGTSGTATEGTDYTDGSGNVDDITISAGSTTGTVSFTPTDDSIYEGEDDETATISVSSVSGGGASESGTQAVTITITDNESAPTVTLATSATSIAENAGSSLTLTATLSVATTETVTVALSTSGTSTEGTDYTDGSGNVDDITISAGSTTGTVSFTPTDDSVYEGNETAIIAVSAVSGGDASESGSQSVTITITENESAPTIALTKSASSIDENSGSTITLTATISGVTDSAVTVALSTSGTATEGTDYGTISDITISAGATTGTATFDPTDDNVYEDDETATIDISGVSGKSGVTENGTQQQSITISENESAPTVTLATSATSIAENAGSSLTLTATLSVATTADVTVALSTSGTATEGTDYTDGSGNVDDITISAGSTTGTVSFTPTDDSLYDATSNETATIAISGVSGGSASESGTQTVTITITDNESAPTVTLATSATSIAENSASNLTLTATLSGATFQDVTVSISTSGTATEGTDYATISDITISAGSTTGTAVFNPTDDSDETDTVTATVAISGVSGGGASESGSQSVTISILDDESVPRVSLTVSATSIAENAGSSLTLTATLSKTAAENVIVTLGTSGAATEGTDYGSLSNITVTAGNTTGTVSFTPTDDSLYDASSNETAVVAIDSVSGGDALENGTQSVTITITDNESAPTVTLATSASSIAENASGTVTITATSSVATYQDITVSIGASGGTEGTDYGTISDITISAGATTGTATLDPTDDNVYEDDETVTGSIDGVSGGNATESGTQTVSITISENESAPTVTLSTSATSIAENAGTSLTLTATLSVATTADVTVTIGTAGTATEGTDYTDGSGNIDDITISAGSTTGTVSFTPSDDSGDPVYEENETAIISIDGVSGGSASESGSQSVTITITENESAPTVTLTTSATSINENAGSSLTLTATLSIKVDETVTVSLGTSGTATEGTDYTDGSGSIDDITISAGSTTGTVSFTPTDDSVYEDDETATIAIDSVSGGGASENGTQSVSITISENESAPTVTLTTSATSINENAGSSLTLTATLSGATDETVAVSLGTSGSATEGTDYTDANGDIDNIIISAGSTTGFVSFTPTDDSVYEDDETATIAITGVSGGGASENGTQTVTITISENESAPTITLTTSATSIAENAGTSLTLTATLSGATDETVTVALGTSGTATEGTDYTDGSGDVDDITISAGSTTGTVSFTPTDDTIYDATSNETATISVTGVSGGGASESGTQAVTITITDNESAPTVTLATASTSIDENSTDTITLTATISNGTYEDVTVSIDGTGGTGTEGTDFGTVSDITISAGATAGTVTFDPTDDSVYEGNETAGISVSGVSGGSASESGSQSVTITITENESAPTVTLATSATSIAENAGSSLTLTATLSVATTADVTVSLGTSGTATEGTDYTDGSGSIDDITISAGSTTGTVNFTPTDDSLYDAASNETATISIDGVSGGSASEDGTQAVTITITDNESAPSVTLTVSATSIAENAGSSVTVTATLSGATFADVTVGISTSGTATEGTDYTDGSGSIDDITISAGSTTGTVNFTPTDDSVYEGNESATLAISSVSGGSATESGSQSKAIQITENESAPTVTLATSATSIAENAGTSLTLTATLSVATTTDVTVSLSTSGTATEGTDYSDGSGDVDDITISAGSTTGTVSFTPTDDSIYDAASDETATIAISGVSGGSATENGTQTVTITVTDDDSAPTVTLATASTSIDENSTDTITLTATLSNGTYQDVTVSIDGTGGTGTEGTDFGTVSDITISAGSTTGTVTFDPTDDSVYEGNETAGISVSGVSGGGASESGSQSVTITITENESAPTVALTVSASSIAENAGSSLTITATISGTADETVTVALGTSGTSTEGTDYTDGSGSVDDITISAGSTTGTVSFTPTNDSTYEGSETAIFAITSVSGGGASEDGTQSETITITDDESAPTVTLTTSATSIAENAGSSLTLTATLSGATDATITVALDTSGTATEGTDYTDGSGNIDDITISAGATTGTVSFTPTDDSIYDATSNETATISINGVSGKTGVAENSTPQAVTITITDNESAPTTTLTTSATSIAENAGSSLTLTATLNTATYADVTVSIDGTGGTGTEGTDFGTVSDITISAGSTTGTTSFTPTDDSIYDATSNETAGISVSAVNGGSATEDGTQAVTITITDNESAPTVTLTTSATSIAENAGSSLTLTATLSNGTYQDVTVALSTSGTATEGTDYTDGSGNIDDMTISAGSTTTTANFTPTDDSSNEGNETATIAVSGVSGGSASESGTQSVTITITDDDNFSFSVADVTVLETAGSATITVLMSSSSSSSTTIQYATSDNTATTAGSDYTATNGTLTFSAGDISESFTVSINDDDICELTNETFTITLSNASAGSISDDTATVTITEQNFMNCGTANSFSSSEATAWLSRTEFHQSGLDSDDDPYKNINLHKALAYSNGSGLMLGSGEVIAIMDSGFQIAGAGSNTTTHHEFSGKTITALNSTYFSTYNSSNSWHGTFVAGVAAGNYQTGSSMGVAPAASLHIHQYNLTGTASSFAGWWALGTDDAKSDGAVAQNNSWGFDDSQTLNASQTAYNASWAINDYVTYKNNNSLSSSATLAAHASLDNDSNGANDVWASNTAAQWDTYVASLNSFQDTGVIVFALTNNATFDDADVSAALPELYSQLEEAWITVANVDIDGTGAMSGKTYTLQSAPCGSTADYCLAADGQDILGPGGNDFLVGGFDYELSSGTSFAAPQVSGAIALLASHFPNHSPAQLTDRLLASAYNDWAAFGVDGTVTFGNGVVHGYSTDYGHGIMDIYAALQPITSNMLGKSVYTSNTNLSNFGQLQSAGQSLENSYLKSSKSFGDAIGNALSNEVNYFYDSLNGGFAYKMDGHVIPHSNTKPVINLDAEMNGMKSASTLNNYLNIDKTDYKNILFEGSLSHDEVLEKQVSLTLGYSAIPVQSFFNFDQMAFNGITEYNLPFLNKQDQGLSLNTFIEGKRLNFSLSSTTPIRRTDDQGQDIDMGSSTSLMSSMEYTVNEDLVFGLLSGFVNEKEGFLGLKGNEAFSLDNSSNLSKFSSLKIQKNIKDDFALTLTGTLAFSDFKGDSSSLLKSADSIQSDSFSVTLNKANLFKNDNIAFSISQPNRVRNGSLILRLSDLADKNGNINIKETKVYLEPSGRQIDTAIAYTKDLSEDFTFSIKAAVTNELNHIKDNNKHYSGYVGLNFKDLKAGISDETNNRGPTLKFEYKKDF